MEVCLLGLMNGVTTAPFRFQKRQIHFHSLLYTSYSLSFSLFLKLMGFIGLVYAHFLMKETSCHIFCILHTETFLNLKLHSEIKCNQLWITLVFQYRMVLYEALKATVCIDEGIIEFTVLIQPKHSLTYYPACLSVPLFSFSLLWNSIT